MNCHLCPEPAAYICGDIDRLMCEEHAHDGPGSDCCLPMPYPAPPGMGALIARFSPPSAAAEVLRQYLAAHEGKLGKHWLYAAIGRIVAGDSEAETLADFGWVPDAEAGAAFRGERDHALNMRDECAGELLTMRIEHNALRAKLDRVRETVAEAQKYVSEPEAFRWLRALENVLEEP